MNDSLTIAPGQVVDGFTVGEAVHAGGMGVLYRVSGPQAPFPMVMKVPRLGPGEPPETVVTYEVESTVLAALRSPHVPRFVAAGDLATGPYLVMEWIEGRSLKDWVARAPIRLEELQRLGGALCAAVHALHQQEVIHLDLKPSNVMVRDGGEAVLLDFGLAHHAHYPDLLAEEFRHPIGSAPYISPEQVLGVRTDPRSDVFSLGCILYQLATGELPFGHPTSPAGLRKRLYRDPVPPRALVPSLPEWLQEVLLKALEPSAAARHPSAAQLAFDLTHPDQVPVGPRGRRHRRVAGFRQLLRWIRAAGLEPSAARLPTAQVARAPIVMAAVATAHGNEAQFEALRRAVRRLLDAEPGMRLACVTAIKPTSELGGSSEEETATRQRIKHLVLLRHWAEPLGLPAGRISFHAIAASDPAGALLDYARANGVDQIVIGAPPPELPLKGIMQTVSVKVALGAPCSVTVVRPPAGR
ncbi:MAG TPA: bifunctional serine/threonine-protein kinase/universal stress protein [Anaeromyxobacteraceae bacterium]|nr:bifunctional serine/threonine-protein kinase/universal stress protein [Anaeromyxobacteraceae bacterium]